MVHQMDIVVVQCLLPVNEHMTAVSEIPCPSLNRWLKHYFLIKFILDLKNDANTAQTLAQMHVRILQQNNKSLRDLIFASKSRTGA